MIVLKQFDIIIFIFILFLLMNYFLIYLNILLHPRSNILNLFMYYFNSSSFNLFLHIIYILISFLSFLRVIILCWCYNCFHPGYAFPKALSFIFEIFVLINRDLILSWTSKLMRRVFTQLQNLGINIIYPILFFY